MVTYAIINPTPERRMSMLRLLARTVERPGGCLEMTGYSSKGYRLFSFEGRVRAAHVASYTAFVGPVPAGRELHHACFNRSCIEPSHLQALTRAEHRAIHGKAITHCKRGHEFTPENTFPQSGNRGRGCRTCKRAWAAEKKRNPETRPGVLAQRRVHANLYYARKRAKRLQEGGAS